jgi:hypothetical protein
MMEKVNRNNYEVWVIDYFDGKLSAVEVKSLLTFLDKHPDLKEEFDTFDLTSITAEQLTFDNKSALKKEPISTYKNIGEENYEELFIAYHEGDLTAKEEETVDAFIGINPQLHNEFELSGKVILSPDESLLYEGKADLKRNSRMGIYWWVSSSAAAVFLIMLYFFNTNWQSSSELQQFGEINRLPNYVIPFEITDEPAIDLKDIPVSTPESLIVPASQQISAESHQTLLALQVIDPMSSRNVRVQLGSDNAFIVHEVPVFDFNADNTLAMDEPAEAAEAQKRNGPLARIVRNITGKVSVEKSDKIEKKGKKDPAFVRALDQSITVINTLTGNESELVKTYDEEGNLTRYEYEGETISWSRAIASKQPKE